MEGGNIPGVVIFLLFFPDQFGIPRLFRINSRSIVTPTSFSGASIPLTAMTQLPSLSHLHLLYLPFLTRDRGYNPRCTILELEMLVGEFYSILNIKVD